MANGEIVNQQPRMIYDLTKVNSAKSIPSTTENNRLVSSNRETRKVHSNINKVIHNKNLLGQKKEALLKIHVSGLTQMFIQNHQLKQENIVLQRQFSLFRQLIKDPMRLNSVLNRLNIQN
ncbi:unnamed protein product [Meganyctiphanes norvegica]|uniref:Uncharacterized protein n=1 Tax=Meganyctiphanes norvegica TaxID=48144 RepID=A0AAV2QLB7_MEGNR